MPPDKAPLVQLDNERFFRVGSRLSPTSKHPPQRKGKKKMVTRSMRKKPPYPRNEKIYKRFTKFLFKVSSKLCNHQQQMLVTDPRIRQECGFGSKIKKGFLVLSSQKFSKSFLRIGRFFTGWV